MNKKVFISMLSLSVAFLIGMYVLKIFFPQEFMMSIQNDKIIAIGTFIDSHEWLYYLCCGITAFITYYLYCCACSGRLRLKWYECLYIVIAIVIVRLVSLFDVNLSTGLTYATFVVLPALTKGNIKVNALVYLIHIVSQCLSLTIRNLPLYLQSVNFITMFIFGIESYFWLLLMYIIFNYRKEK